MPANQNPVFTDGDTIQGDGTVQNPLEAIGGGGSPGGSAGDVQFNNGAGGFTNADGVDAGATCGFDSGDNFFSILFPGGIAIESGEIEVESSNLLLNVTTTGNSTVGNAGGGSWKNQSPNISLTQLQTFANNAAAVAGGLAVNQLYRDGGDPEHVCIVH